jgi:hypothetical protein
MDKVTGHGNQVWLELNEQAQSQIACRSCEAMRNEAMDAGCIAYLRKPFAQALMRWRRGGSQKSPLMATPLSFGKLTAS